MYSLGSVIASAVVGAGTPVATGASSTTIPTVGQSSSIDNYQANQPNVQQRLADFVNRIVDIDIATIVASMQFIAPNNQELNLLNRFWNTNQNLIPGIVSDLFYVNALYLKIDSVSYGDSEGSSFYNFKVGLANQINGMITNNDGYKLMMARLINTKGMPSYGQWAQVVFNQLLSAINSAINNTELQEAALQIDRDNQNQQSSNQDNADEYARQAEIAMQQEEERQRQIEEERQRQEDNKHTSTPVNGDAYTPPVVVPVVSPAMSTTTMMMIGGAALVAILMLSKK
jgi:hypothetical protein